MSLTGSGKLILKARRRKRTCESATASLFVHAESWVEEKRRWLRKARREWMYGPEYSRAILELEVEVDEESGADGAAAPTLRIFFDPAYWTGEGIESLAESEWTHGQGCEIEAFYGNDAPQIDNNVVKFCGWSEPSVIEVDWRGSMRWGQDGPEQLFHLQGPVRIESVSTRVKCAEDVETIFAASLPGFALERLGPAKVEHVDFGDVMPSNRRNWETHSWTFK